MSATDGDALSLEGVKTRIRGRHAFIHERVLELIVRESSDNGSVSFSKAELASRLGCCIRTLDRAVMRLRRGGYITSKPVFKSNGAQVGNEYRATAKGVALAGTFKVDREPRKR